MNTSSPGVALLERFCRLGPGRRDGRQLEEEYNNKTIDKVVLRRPAACKLQQENPLYKQRSDTNHLNVPSQAGEIIRKVTLNE